MLALVMFGIIGTILNVGTGYWICFGFYCVLTFIELIVKIIKFFNER